MVLLLLPSPKYHTFPSILPPWYLRMGEKKSREVSREVKESLWDRGSFILTLPVVMVIRLSIPKIKAFKDREEARKKVGERGEELEREVGYTESSLPPSSN